MRTSLFWKNFMLGEEVSIAGVFVYNGLRRFHELTRLDYADEVFEVLYDLSVGLERLLKVAVALLEHRDGADQEALERSLITHNHAELLRRIRQRVAVNLDTPHNDLLSLLSTFYKRTRYERFSLSSAFAPSTRERDVLCSFLAKHLRVELSGPEPIFGTLNGPRHRKFMRKTVHRIAATLYQIIQKRAGELGLYTHELRHGSKAYTVFLGEADIRSEDVLWKELLVFFMNTKATSGYLRFLRDIPPLDFDPGLVDEYLDCFRSDAAKAQVRDELDGLYRELADKGDRLQLMDVLGTPGLCLDDQDPEDDEPLD